MKRTPSNEELARLKYEELEELAAELAIEDEEIKEQRHLFIKEFWRRMEGGLVTAEDLAEGGVAAAKIGEEPILWAKVEGAIYALSNRCPHRGFPLHKGKLEGYTLTCAYHGGQYDIRTGACLRHPTETYPCESFEVRLLEDGTVAVQSAKQ